MKLTKTEIELLIKKRFELNKVESQILQEFSEAVHLRLAQVPENFTEAQCLKCWETYRKERLPVYSIS